MSITFWVCFLLLFTMGHCYRNFKRVAGSTVSQSSTFRNASYAVDSKYGQTYEQCAHTGKNEKLAWFQLDLGKAYSLKSVKIYYRNQTNWPPYRFRQFYLDVSNASAVTFPQKERCYKDNTTAPDTPPSVIDIPCKQTARYVIIGTTYKAEEDTDSTGPVLEICEIEVIGCPVSHFGESCSLCQGCTTCDVVNGDCSCSNNCLNDSCNPATGLCSECKEGFWNKSCRSVCNYQCLAKTCFQENGTCTKGCQDFHYGYECEHTCSSKCYPSKCDRFTGECSGCEKGFYGTFCENSCSQFCKIETCSSLNGICKGGCKSNWTGGLCDRCDSSHFGPNCSLTCSANCKENACSNITGFCTIGCKNGYHKDICNEICSPYCKNGCNRDSGKCDNGCIDTHFGIECRNICSSGCVSTCNRTDGSCSCKSGWKGKRCDECDGKFFGEACEHKCSLHCYNGTCDPRNGSCVGGCSGKFSDDQCTDALYKSSLSHIPVTSIGAGLGSFFFILVATVIVVVLFRLRRRNHRNTAVPPLESNSAGNDLPAVSIEDPEKEPYEEKPEEAVYYKNSSVAKDIPVKDIHDEIKQKESNENSGFIKEFKSLPYGERFGCSTAKQEDNVPKNRFKTTFPYDHSRVILDVSDGFDSDYINANYIENMDGRREFIACQGPRSNTIVDHWRMIWQEHVEYIVMLTNLIEGPKVKCNQYWPNESNELNIHPFHVKMIEEKVYAYYVVRKMILQRKRMTGSRMVVQFHFTRWPDHGTPNPLNLIMFHRHFRQEIRSSKHPIIVHCSAGIGRTGTFIALDVLSRYGEEHNKINVIEFVKAMRKDRMTMVQNVDQYVFLYHALYEYFRRKREIVSRREFFELYGEINTPETRKRLRNEFNAVTSLKPNYAADDFITGRQHTDLNFTNSALPVERYLVYLTSVVKGRKQYYNAVNVSSFTRAEEFISAQYPVSGAAIDLARLLVDHKSSFLISLNPLTEIKGMTDWVDDRINTIHLHPYEITKMTQTMMSNALRKTDIQIKRKHGDLMHPVKIFECLHWSFCAMLPTEPFTMTKLIKQFCLRRTSDPDGPITIVSKDGATGCGVFIAIYNAIEQLQQDDKVDLFTIVQQLQCRRPEMISTKEEYEFCFKAVYDYLNSDSMYANT